ncbi:MAG: hypothetical protein KKH94_05060 [Candidatus Omnitrophica bacterium]|nr:hypothetical protein [Candidatus Omnitrophota bacterium]
MISTKAHNDSEMYSYQYYLSKHSHIPTSLSIKLIRRRKHHQAFTQCLAQTIVSGHGAAKYRHMRVSSESRSKNKELTETLVYRNRSLQKQSYHFRHTA